MMVGHACSVQRLFRGDESEATGVTNPVSFKVRQIWLCVPAKFKHLYVAIWYAMSLAQQK